MSCFKNGFFVINKFCCQIQWCDNSDIEPDSHHLSIDSKATTTSLLSLEVARAQLASRTGFPRKHFRTDSGTGDRHSRPSIRQVAWLREPNPVRMW